MSLRNLVGSKFVDGTKLGGAVDWLEGRDAGQDTGGRTRDSGFKL